VSNLSHAKGQSPQSGKECKWYLVAAMPRWALRDLCGEKILSANQVNTDLEQRLRG
jgi:hypothetical protein